MKKVSKLFLLFFLVGTLFLLIGCFLPSPDITNYVLQGRIMIPASPSKDISGWIPIANATVTLIDSEGITHTAITDSDGYYFFPELAPGRNYIITATGQVDEQTIVVKDIISLVEDGVSYDAGTADCESTALALVVEALLNEGLTPEEIDLEEIQNTSQFEGLASVVCLVLEAYEDVTSHPDIQVEIEDIVDEIIPEPESEPSSPILSSAKEIEFYWFDEDGNPATYDPINSVIDSVNHTVNLTVPFGTDVTALKACFELSEEAIAKVGDVLQESCVTSNDFTNPVTYTVIAEDESTQDWVVTVNITPAKTETEIVEFQFNKSDNPALSYDVNGVIDSVNHTVNLTVPFGTSSSSLIAAFVLSEGASAKVGDTPQVSGETGNAFGSPVIYTITAQDGTTIQGWTVTVSEEAVRYVATSGDDTNDGSESSPWLTIQHALDTTPDLGTIIVKDDGPYDETIVFPAASDADGGRALILKNASGTSPVINGEVGACTVGMFGCKEGTTMEGFAITHVNGDPGRGLYISTDSGNNSSYVTINNCNIDSNDVFGGAAGIWVYIGSNSVVLNNCTISDNIASGNGAGVCMSSQNSSLTLNECIVSNNQANEGGYGGGFYISSGTVILNECEIDYNYATKGGGIYNENSFNLEVYGCNIHHNDVSDAYSAGVFLKGGSSIIGGSGTENVICSNYITDEPATIEDQIGNDSESLHLTEPYQSGNYIYAECPSNP